VPFGEPALSPKAPMTSAEIYAYAERNYSFHSDHGVCAGPQAMIEEFLAVLVDGKLPKDGLPAKLDPQVQAALSDIEHAIDYALLGLKAYASVFSLWPVMARTYATLATITETWAQVRAAPVVALRDRLRGHIDRINGAGYLATEDRRVDRENVYADMYAQCEAGLSGKAPAIGLAERISLCPAAAGDPASRQLRAVLQRHFSAGVQNASQHLDDLHACAMGFLHQTQAVLRSACEVQRDINQLLGRQPPRRPFDATDIDTHNRLRGDTESRAPYLVDELEEIFGIRIRLDKDVLEITDRVTAVPA
jgi:hypothetical protein